MDIGRLLGKNSYADARIERSVRSSVRISDGEVKSSHGYNQGIGVRVLQNGSWGFASCDLSANQDAEKAIAGMLEKAAKLARLAKGRIRLALPKPEKRKVGKVPPITEPEGQVHDLLEAAKDFAGKKVASSTISCTDTNLVKEFYSSEGAGIVQKTGYTYVSCMCVARDGEKIQRGMERDWSRSGFKKIDLGIAGLAKEKALRLLDADPPPKGRFNVVLDPEVTGVFSHEALGHACEADSVIDRESILSDKMGKRIGNPLVTIADDPTAENFGHYAYDDEGVKAKRTVLVEKGVLKGYINSMETAHALRMTPNGHARAQNYSAVPVVRMSNTYFQSGDASLEDVFDVRSGVYVKGVRGGSVDIFSGGFMFKAEEAYGIKNGEKGKIMRDVTISGSILHTLLDVECVGKDFGTSPGMCGKFGQDAPVSDGGPHIRVRNVAIG